MRKMIFWILCGVITSLFYACLTTKPDYKTETENPPNSPKTEREFRAAWVATVVNINWPSKPGLSSDKQKREAIKLINRLQKNKFNAGKRKHIYSSVIFGN